MSKPTSSLTKLILPISVIALSAGSTLLGKKLATQNRAATTILSNVKQAFKKEGPIEGSWIESTAFTFQKFAFKTTAYKGGIDRYEDNKLVTYEFIADAKTGTILALNRI